MSHIRFFLVLAAFWWIAINTFPQRYFVKSYTIENGLPTRSVSDACQDSTGCMWFATKYGISSYDGFYFTNYTTANGLPAQQYRKVKFDELGNIWAVPERLADTIAFLQNNTWKKIIPASKIPNVEISVFELLYKNTRPVICLGSVIGLDIYQNGGWIHLDVSKDPQKNQILSLTSSNGKFYALTRAGVIVVEEDEKGWHIAELIKSDNEILIAIKFEHPGQPDEKLWMLSCNRLGYLQQGKYTLLTDGFALPKIYTPGVAWLNFDNRGNVFFGNNCAKYFVNRTQGSVSPLLIINGLSSAGAASIFVDREQNVWFSDSRGVDKISNLSQLRYFENNGLLENEVTAIAELANGNMVFGHNGGLTVFDHHSFTRIPFPVSKTGVPRVLDIMQDKQGNVWLAANSLGFGKMNAGGMIRWYPVDSTRVATTVHQTQDGTIWAGTNKNLFFLQNDKFIEFEHSDNINPAFRKIFSRQNGDLICVGMDGFFAISGDDIKAVPIADDVKSHSVFSYYESKSGVEYVGTQNGLCTIENGVIRKFNNNGVTFDSPVYFIIEDDDQNYWLGSDNGLIKWDGKNIVETFSLQTGLAGRETNRSAGMVDSQGNVWVGTDMGLSCFLKGFSDIKTSIPGLKLMDFEDNHGANHPFADHCSIGYTDNSLVFHFRGISFVNEDLLLYRYKLTGFDHDWQFVNQSNLDKVKYTGLQPGKYQLMVQARNGNGEWSGVVTSGTITIKSPVYRSWWFILIVFIVISLIIYGIIKILVQQKYNLQLQNEISERLQAEEQLSESQKLYQLISDKMTDVVWLMDLKGRSTYVSPSIEQFTGYSADEYMHQSIDDRFTPESVAVAKRLFGSELPKLIAQPEKLHGYFVTQRMEYLCKNGETKWGELLMTPFFGENDTWIGIHGVTRDITDRKRAEEALNDKANELKRFNSLLVGRELKMIELKKEINELLVNANQPEKYIVHE